MVVKLQWGRVVIDAERRRRAGIRSRPADASMGPRRDRRGESCRIASVVVPVMLQWGRVVIDAERRAGRRRSRSAAGASMGPRRDRRGERLHQPPLTTRPILLQWGRVVIDAESDSPLIGLLEKDELQWGRVVIDAERRAGAVRCRPGIVASMGPRRDRRGEAHRRRPDPDHEAASMGPRRDRRGERPRRHEPRDGGVRFNGAAS